ncbi:hypothetical protein CEXT_114851 [Caerostris extrusa]|uniref:Uncharacterized protein n=1 Tax=Caerostris extrusa TaxID=172846 RepID=A0AAV4SME0_CAEEX|nr:hypothetical protein CEXT_114851 [Caerostris extrusa]
MHNNDLNEAKSVVEPRFLWKVNMRRGTTCYLGNQSPEESRGEGQKEEDEGRGRDTFSRGQGRGWGSTPLPRGRHRTCGIQLSTLPQKMLLLFDTSCPSTDFLHRPNTRAMLQITTCASEICRWATSSSVVHCLQLSCPRIFDIAQTEEPCYIQKATSASEIRSPVTLM